MMKPIAACLALAALALGGCAIKEKHVYKSTPDMPMSVSIVNWTTGEQVWSRDIPVGEQLVLRFLDSDPIAHERGYEEMSWVMHPIGSEDPKVKNRMRVPPSQSRRIETTLRPAPELPTTASSGN
jgi:hypothetical protein